MYLEAVQTFYKDNQTLPDYYSQVLIKRKIELQKRANIVETFEQYPLSIELINAVYLGKRKK